MSEAAVEQSGILCRINEAMDRTHIAAVALLTTASVGGGMFARSILDTPDAFAATPSGAVKGSDPAQVQEYLQVQASNAGGDALPLQNKTFTFIERCKDHLKPVSRTVTYTKSEQPLGKCDAGSSVTVTEGSPLQGEWVHQSGTKKGPVKASVKKNHFKFIEQQVGAPSAAQPAQPGTPAQPGQPSQPTQPPTQPTQPTQPPGGGGETGEPFASGNTGVDISWAQCGTADETPSGEAFGIVDANDGLGYSANPCLPTEAANFTGNQLNFYVNTGWNSSSTHIDPNSPKACEAGDEDCLAYNYGYNAGVYAVNTVASASANVGTEWWLDVESNATWSSDTTQNQNSLQGEHDALIDNGATDVGVYSTTVQWGDITGSWQNGWSSWGATTWTTAADAKTYCIGHQFTGGPSKLMQYLPGDNIDHDVAC